jgi:hypothetical protein
MGGKISSKVLGGILRRDATLLQQRIDMQRCRQAKG